MNIKINHTTGETQVRLTKRERDTLSAAKSILTAIGLHVAKGPVTESVRQSSSGLSEILKAFADEESKPSASQSAGD